ncbi:MAG: choice-of-anchor R domain-containing protein, partial [Desulfobaccales bacterium]
MPPLFDSFSVGPVGPEGTTLLDVQLLLKSSSSSGSSSGFFSVALYSDSGNHQPSPGTLLQLIGTLNDGSLTSDLSVVDFPTAYHLDADTRYWIELSSTDGSTAEWSWSYDQSGIGVAGEYFGHDNT